MRKEFLMGLKHPKRCAWQRGTHLQDLKSAFCQEASKRLSNRSISLQRQVPNPKCLEPPGPPGHRCSGPPDPPGPPGAAPPRRNGRCGPPNEEASHLGRWAVKWIHLGLVQWRGGRATFFWEKVLRVVSSFSGILFAAINTTHKLIRHGLHMHTLSLSNKNNNIKYQTHRRQRTRPCDNS